MTIRKEIINSLTQRCENKLDYYDLVNERTEEIDFRLIVEFILDCILDVWDEEKNS